MSRFPFHVSALCLCAISPALMLASEEPSPKAEERSGFASLLPDFPATTSKAPALKKKKEAAIAKNVRSFLFPEKNSIPKKTTSRSALESVEPAPLEEQE